MKIIDCKGVRHEQIVAFLNKCLSLKKRNCFAHYDESLSRHFHNPKYLFYQPIQCHIVCICTMSFLSNPIYVYHEPISNLFVGLYIAETVFIE